MIDEQVFSNDRGTTAAYIDDGDSDDGDNDRDEDTDPVDVYLTLSEGESDNGSAYSLPPHQRCACHTLNLIATTDAAKAETDAVYNKTYRSTFAKCQTLWNRYGCSSLAVDAVTDAYGVGLKRPNSTRWNSVFHAVDRHVRLVNDKGDDEFRKLCVKLDVPKFTPAEKEFLEDYAVAMKPVTQALNILQSEAKMYMGYLLPTICILREKLVSLQTTRSSCLPLVAAVLAGIDDRFAPIFGDKDAIAAAILHPQFRNTWTDNEAMVDSGIRHIRSLLQSSVSLEQTQSSSGQSTANNL